MADALKPRSSITKDLLNMTTKYPSPIATLAKSRRKKLPPNADVSLALDGSLSRAPGSTLSSRSTAVKGERLQKRESTTNMVAYPQRSTMGPVARPPSNEPSALVSERMPKNAIAQN
jgi:hypothetical protein